MIDIKETEIRVARDPEGGWRVWVNALDCILRAYRVQKLPSRVSRSRTPGFRLWRRTTRRAATPGDGCCSRQSKRASMVAPASTVAAFLDIVEDKQFSQSTLRFSIKKPRLVTGA
jgi:hypothetical protein